MLADRKRDDLTPAFIMFANVRHRVPDPLSAYADLRAAVCLEDGVAIEDIDPREGYDLSRRRYEAVRDQWRGWLAENPDPYWYLQIRNWWLQRRPEWDDDWLAPEVTTPDPLMLPLFELEAAS
jgi:hypothetical protein